MKTCDEMVNSLLERREQFLSEQRQKRKTAAKITAVGGSCALAAFIGVLALNSGIMREKKTVVPDNSSAVSDNSSSIDDEPVKDDPVKEPPPAPDFSSVIWADNISSPSISSEDSGISQKNWNDKIIKYSLYYAFEENDNDCTFSVLAEHRCFDNDNCIFNTKTREQFLDEDYAWTEKVRCMEMLTKMGDELKYGEALYLTGTPDGVKWAKEYYDRTVSEIGEELLSKYIVDGEFLKDELICDIETEWEELNKTRNDYDRAYNDYRTEIYKTLMKQLVAKGIYCELKSGSNGLIIYVSKADFAELTLENPENWVFGLASKDSDGTDLVVIDEAYGTVSYISTSD